MHKQIFLLQILDSFILKAAGIQLEVDSFKNDFSFRAYPNPTKIYD
jgi:hypothetical protein